MKYPTLSLSLNPVLVKELRGRMRGPRAYLFLTGVLVILGLVSFGLFQLAMPRYGSFNQPNVAAGAIIGQFVFVGLVFLTLVMICVIAPSLTSTAISGEHQRKTIDLLMATPLAPFTILIGKLGAALSYVVLILLAALPMMSLAYVFGGVTLSDLVRAFLVMGGFALAYAVLGLFFSALFRRTGIAVGASFLFVAFALFGTLFVYVVVAVMRGDQPPNWMLALNPFSVLASALVDGVVTDPNNLSGSSSATPLLWGLAGGRFDSVQTKQLALWVYALAIYGWLTVFLFALTTQLIKPVQRFRFRPLTWLLFILLFVGPIAAAILLYGALGYGGLRAAWRWWTYTEQNVVAPANFATAWERNWQVDAALSSPDSSGGAIHAAPVAAVNPNGKHALRVWNSDSETLRIFAISQPLNLPLPDGATVRLRVTMRIAAHSAPVCGAQGDACPLMVKLKYTARSGKSHEWARGFYASGRADGKVGLPSRCKTCPSRAALARVPKDQWFTFESGDLFEKSLPAELPKSLDEIVLTFSGTQFEVQAAEVGVLVHEGRPFTYGKKEPTRFVWSVNNLVPWWVWSFINPGKPAPPIGGLRFGGFVPQVVPVMVLPQPTAAPPPTASP